MRKPNSSVTIVVGMAAFVLYGGHAAAQDHGDAGHGQMSLTEQLMRADTNEDGTVTALELVSLLAGGRDGHPAGDTPGRAHHGNVDGHGSPHGDASGGHGSAGLAALLGGHGGAAISDLSQADLVARVEMLVSHADTNDDAALNASEVEALVAMLSTGGGH